MTILLRHPALVPSLFSEPDSEDAGARSRGPVRGARRSSASGFLNAGPGLANHAFRNKQPTAAVSLVVLLAELPFLKVAAQFLNAAL